MSIQHNFGRYSLNESIEYDFGPRDSESYRRALYHGSPENFRLHLLPITKFGRKFHFGMRVLPRSRCWKITTTTSEKFVCEYYDIWRTWEDCLCFQDNLELRYSHKSIQKRRRLKAGKGVKRNGVYIHDSAASFESLPCGPDPKSVAKDIYKILPPLASRGTLFPPSQKTLDQRERELSAFFEAFFQEDVPSLIRELREDRAIRDFFGCRLTDHELEVKNKGKRPTMAVSDKFFQLNSSPTHFPPHARFPPVTPSLRSFPTRDASPSTPPCMSTMHLDGATSEYRHDTDGRFWTSSSNSSSLPSSSTYSHYTTDSRPRGRSPSQTKRFDMTSDFPLFLSVSTRDLLPSRPVTASPSPIPRNRKPSPILPSRPVPHPPTYVPQRLETLLEDVELGSPVTVSPSPIPRNRKLSHIRSLHRKRVVWQDVDEVFSREDDDHDTELPTPVDGTVLKATTVTKPTSLPPSVSLSSVNDNRSSTDLVRPSSTCSNDSRVEFDFPLVFDGESLLDPSLPRGISQPLLVTAAIPTNVEDDCLIDLGEDLLETYFGGSEPFVFPNEDAENDNLLLSNVPESPVDFSMHWQEVPDRASYVDKPTSGYHVPLVGIQVTATADRSDTDCVQRAKGRDASGEGRTTQHHSRGAAPASATIY